MSCSGVATIPYLQVTGVSFSGTTLLAFLLNAHPKMASLGEMGPASFVDVTEYSCSCGRPFLQCEFNQAIEREAKGMGSDFRLSDWRTRYHVSKRRWIDLPVTRNLPSKALEDLRDRLVRKVPIVRSRIDATNQRIENVARATLALTGKDVFVDTSKDARRVAYLKDIAGIDVYVLHLLKDVRQGVASVVRRKKAGPRRAAAAWQRGNLDSDKARRHVPPERFLRLRYDHLASDPQGTVDRISEFMGTETAPIPHNFYDSQHHIIGNRMRVGSQIGAINVDESWRQLLTEHDLATVAKTAGKTNNYFGFGWPV